MHWSNEIVGKQVTDDPCDNVYSAQCVTTDECNRLYALLEAKEDTIHAVEAELAEVQATVE